MQYEANADGTLSNGRVFFDMTDGKGFLDGMKVDRQGHLYVTGPGGVWILSHKGKHLGTIRAPEPATNIAWGDNDGRMLYITAGGSVYRIHLSIPGVRP
jgi:gluconolactonase